MNGARKELQRRTGGMNGLLPQHPSVAAANSGAAVAPRQSLVTGSSGANKRVLVASPDEVAAGMKDRDELYIDPKGGGVKRRPRVGYSGCFHRAHTWSHCRRRI